MQEVARWRGEATLQRSTVRRNWLRKHDKNTIVTLFKLIQVAPEHHLPGTNVAEESLQNTQGHPLFSDSTTPLIHVFGMH